MSMNDQGPNISGAPDEHPASTVVPVDKEIAYVVNALGEPAFPTPGRRLPGHKQADPAAVRAVFGERYAAAEAASKAKADAQYRADTAGTRSQHPTPKANFKPAPKKGK